jgi:hypothetical protein
VDTDEGVSAYTYDLINCGSGLQAFVPLVVVNPQTMQQESFHCLIDTGADSCVFCKWVCDETGHNFLGAGVKEENIGAIGGGKVPTAFHTFGIHLLSPDLSSTVWQCDPQLIRCVDTTEHQNVVGVRDFLRNFRIDIDYPSENFTLYVPQSAPTLKVMKMAPSE